MPLPTIDICQWAMEFLGLLDTSLPPLPLWLPPHLCLCGHILFSCLCQISCNLPLIRTTVVAFRTHVAHSGASQVAQWFKNPPANTGDARDSSSIPWSGRSPGEGRKWQPTPVFLPGESHGQRSLVVYSPWGHKKSDATERQTQLND